MYTGARCTCGCDRPEGDAPCALTHNRRRRSDDASVWPPLSYPSPIPNPCRGRAGAWGTAGLLACLAAGSFYQQPPMRARGRPGAAAPPEAPLAEPLLAKSRV